MAFFNWINNKISRLSRRGNQRNAANRFGKKPRKSIFKTSTPGSEINTKKKDAVTPPKEETVPDITSSQIEVNPQITSTTLFYVDRDGKDLREPDILVGESGTKLNLKLPDFPDYILEDTDNFTNWFDVTDQKIVFHYSLKLAAPVKVYTVNYDTAEMLRPVSMVTGKLKQLYEISAPEIPGYRVTNSTGKKYGYFDHEGHDVTFYYRHDQWETVQPVEYYVKLNTAHTVYEYPHGEALRTKMPKGLIIKVFLKIDMKDQQTWYNIGGAQWITGDDVALSSAPSEIDAEDVTKLQSSLTMLDGYIDFLDNKTVDVYDKPYSKVITTLENGTPVKIESTILDDQNIKWYSLKGIGVIPARYVIVN